MYAVKDESVLVRRAMDGDREAFSDLAGAHWRRLLALARSIAADLEAEDVVQDGLVKAWRKIRTLKAPESFGTWLTRIVANTAIARARRRRFFETLDGVAVKSAGNSIDARIDVGRLLVKLAPRQRAVLHLTVVEGLTDHEIGEVLGIASSSVRVHRLRGRRRLSGIVRGGTDP
jgi:RNA polymerase sigma-70 factor (ECF subfamily)